MDITDCRQFSKSFLKEFIDMYKSFPCLWKMKSKEYTDRSLKTQAYCHLIRKCQEVDRTADKDFVVRKINSLRTTFRKTLRRVLESRKEGATPYQPSLWYFHLMLFVVEEEASLSVDDFQDESHDITEFQTSEQFKDMEDPPIEPQFLIVDLQPTNTIKLPSPIPNRKRKLYFDDLEDDIVENQNCRKSINQLKDIDEFDALGKVISGRIKNMQNHQRIIAEKLISDILFHGQLNNLTSKTSIALEKFT